MTLKQWRKSPSNQPLTKYYKFDTVPDVAQLIKSGAQLNEKFGHALRGRLIFFHYNELLS